VTEAITILDTELEIASLRPPAGRLARNDYSVFEVVVIY
jgi:hypothetical protein